MAVAVRQPARPAGPPRPKLRLVPEPPPRARARTGRRRHPAVVYRRRRVGLLGALLLAGVLSWTLWPAGTTAQPAEAPPAPLTVVVGPGETVWQLARPHTPPGEDPAVYVAEVVAANGVDARAVPPGTVLRLPRR